MGELPGADQRRARATCSVAGRSDRTCRRDARQEARTAT